MFSRISFPDNSSGGDGGGEGAGKKRKSLELALKSGLKDHHELSYHWFSSDEHKDEWKRSKGGVLSSVESRRSGDGGYNHESSEEYYFKRKPFLSSLRREAEEEGWPARGSREREA